MAQLEKIGEQLTREAGGEPLVEQLVPSPDTMTDATPAFFREAADYYLTDRGGHPTRKTNSWSQAWVCTWPTSPLRRSKGSPRARCC